MGEKLPGILGLLEISVLGREGQTGRLEPGQRPGRGGSMVLTGVVTRFEIHSKNGTLS